MASNRSQRRSRGVGSASASSSRVTGTVEGECKHCSVTQGQLDRLFDAGYLPRPEVAFACPGLITDGDDIVQESSPNPQENEQVCFIPFLLRGLGFLIHPFLWGILHFYGLQLHHLSPNSILHIACFPHFGMWCKYFCVYPRTRDKVLLDCGMPLFAGWPTPVTLTALPRSRRRIG